MSSILFLNLLGPILIMIYIYLIAFFGKLLDPSVIRKVSYLSPLRLSTIKEWSRVLPLMAKNRRQSWALGTAEGRLTSALEAFESTSKLDTRNLKAAVEYAEQQMENAVAENKSRASEQNDIKKDLRDKAKELLDALKVAREVFFGTNFRCFSAEIC